MRAARFLAVLRRRDRDQRLAEQVLQFQGLDQVRVPGQRTVADADVGDLYAQAFESVSALDKLEGFASHFGADFYRLPRNQEQVQLVRQAWKVPDEYAFGDEVLTPLAYGETLAWRVAASDTAGP